MSSSDENDDEVMRKFVLSTARRGGDEDDDDDDEDDGDFNGGGGDDDEDEDDDDDADDDDDDNDDAGSKRKKSSDSDRSDKKKHKDKKHKDKKAHKEKKHRRRHHSKESESEKQRRASDANEEQRESRKQAQPSSSKRRIVTSDDEDEEAPATAPTTSAVDEPASSSRVTEKRRHEDDEGDVDVGEDAHVPSSRKDSKRVRNDAEAVNASGSGSGSEGSEAGSDNDEKDEEEDFGLDEDDLNLVRENMDMLDSETTTNTRTRKRFRKGGDEPKPKSSDKKGSRALVQESDEDDDLFGDDVPSYADASSKQASSSRASAARDKASQRSFEAEDDFVDDDLEADVADRGERVSRSRELLGGEDDFVDDRKDIASNNLATAMEIFGEDFLKYVRRDEEEEDEEDLLDAYEDEELDDEDLTEEERAARREERRKRQKPKKETAPVSLNEILEPSLLEAGFETAGDDEIRVKDIPERFQVRSQPVLPSNSENELNAEAMWIFQQVFEPLSSASGAVRWTAANPDDPSSEAVQVNDGVVYDRDSTVPKIKAALDLIRNQSFEVPFIANFRREFIESEIGVTELWRIYAHDVMWTSLVRKKRKAQQMLQELRSYLQSEASRSEKVAEAEQDLTTDMADFYLRKAREQAATSIESLDYIERVLGLLPETSTTKQMDDIIDHINLHFGDLVDSIRKARARAEASSSDEPSETTTTTTKFKKPVHKDQYLLAKTAGLLSFLRKFTLGTPQFAENLKIDYLTNSVPEAIDKDPLELASEFVTTAPFATAESVLAGARMAAAQEIASDPVIREHVRTYFMERGFVSARPTARGFKEIDESHQYAFFKYLTKKPITAFADDQFLLLLKAESEGLVELLVGLPLSESAQDEEEHRQRDALAARKEQYAKLDAEFRGSGGGNNASGDGQKSFSATAEVLYKSLGAPLRPGILHSLLDVLQCVEKTKLFQQCLNLYTDDSAVSLTAQQWNAQRRLILLGAFQTFLFPRMVREMRVKLEDQAIGHVCRGCSDTLFAKAMAAPYPRTLRVISRRTADPHRRDGSKKKKSKGKKSWKDENFSDDEYNTDNSDGEDESRYDTGDRGKRRVVEEMEQDDGSERGASVLAFAAGTQDTPSFAAMLDGNGEIVDFLRLPHFLLRVSDDDFTSPQSRQREEDLDKIKSLITRRRPHVVALGLDPNEWRTPFKLLDRCLRDIPDNEHPFVSSIKVELVDLQTAQLKESNPRFASEFKDYPPILRRAIYVGRLLQNPLNEYASLCLDGASFLGGNGGSYGTGSFTEFSVGGKQVFVGAGGSTVEDELLSLRLHPLQAFVSPMALRSALIESLIDATNKIGVDFNHAIAYPHASATLQFVAGLGPRKAKSLLELVRRNGGRCRSRADIVLKGKLGPVVLTNCLGFLRVRGADVATDDDEDNKFIDPDQQDASSRSYIDVLDMTLIHPESYDLARKIARDALDLDTGDETRPSLHVEQLLTAREKLNEVDLDHYAQHMEANGVVSRKIRSTLYDIRQELYEFGADKRGSFVPMSDDEKFFLITGQSNSSLYEGMLVDCVISKITDGKDRIAARLSNDLLGWIFRDKLSDSRVEDIRDFVFEGQHVQARVLRVKKDKLSVDLSCRSSDLQNRAGVFRLPRDAFYDNEEEAREVQVARERELRQARKPKYTSRSIVHRKFKNIDLRKALELLQAAKDGEAIIRPSSRGSDHLVVSWKLAPGIIQHVDIREEGKPAPQELGKHLWIGKERYDDLDEILARYVSPLFVLVQDMKRSKCYMNGTVEEIDASLRAEKEANASRIPYKVTLVAQKPGRFLLAYLPSRSIRHEYFVVGPDGFHYRSLVFPTPDKLISWFKMNYNAPIPNKPTAAPQAMSVSTSSVSAPVHSSRLARAAPAFSSGSGYGAPSSYRAPLNPALMPFATGPAQPLAPPGSYPQFALQGYGGAAQPMDTSRAPYGSYSGGSASGPGYARPPQQQQQQQQQYNTNPEYGRDAPRGYDYNSHAGGSRGGHASRGGRSDYQQQDQYARY